MPAKSIKQQRFMGMVRRAQKTGQAASPEVAEVAASMKKKAVKDFASTKHKGLPMKKEEFINEEDYDRMKDRQLERGTWRPRSKSVARSGGSQPKPMPQKKKYDGMSALDHVKAEIRKKHGKGAIMGESKKDCVKAEKKTMHNCAKKVCSEQWGVGECIYGQHAIPDAEGNVAWYDVMFEHGIEKGVDVSTLEVLEEGSHGEHVEHQGQELTEKKKGLWANIHAKRKRGEKPAKPGDKDYPETLNVEGYAPGDVDQKVGAVTAIPKKEQDDARARILAKTKAKRKAKLAERADTWHPDPEKDRKLGGPGANQRAREDRAAASKPKEDPKKLKKGESYMDYAKRQSKYKSSGSTARERLAKAGANVKPKERKRDKVGKALGRLVDKIGGIKKESVEGKSFKQFLEEGNRTGRMMHKSKTQVTGHISADRGSDEKKNKEGRKNLEKDLKKHGIGHKKGVGEYKYGSGETGREVSYQTSKPDKMSKRRFGKVMRRLGRKHGQESVITKDKDKSAKLHYTEKGSKAKSDSIGKTKAGKHPEGYGETSGTKVRSKKLPKKTNKGSFHYG